MARYGNYLIWDFDGTLGYRPGRWSGTLVQLIKRHTGKDINIETIRPYMQRGFRWDDHTREHPKLPPEEWWAELLPNFEEALIGCELSASEARSLAKKMRSAYTDIAEWRIFEDTRPVLEELQREGWTHAILSNHVPELTQIIEGLGIRDLFVSITNSAETGFEKPHPQAFQAALATLHVPANVWMIGDNVHADVLGAESAGIRAILVRNKDERARRQAKDLAGVKGFLQAMRP